MMRLLVVGSCLLAVALAVGCGGDLASSPTEGQVPGLASAKITVRWPEAEALTIPAETQSIRVRVLVGGVEKRNIIVPRQPGLVTTVTLTDLPVGSAIFTGTAYPTTDGTGSVLATGQATVTLVAGQTAVVSLVLTPVPPTEDTTPPTVSITAPANGATVSGVISIEATATDNVAVAGVRFLADAVYLGEDTTSPYGTSLNTTCFPNCSLLITATARDAAGNVGTDFITVTVNNITPPPPDTTPPTVQITYPLDGATVSGIVTIEATASDNVAVAGVRLIADALDLGEDITSPYQASLDTTLFPNGSLIISAVARDTSDNQAIDTAPVTVENINLGPFEPFRGRIVSFAMRTGSGEGLSLAAESLYLDDFGQIVLNCRPEELSPTGWIKWYVNLERRTDGVVDAEFRFGGYIDPITLGGTVERGIHPGYCEDRLRLFSVETGEIISTRWVTVGSIQSVQYDGGLTFNNTQVGLEDGAILTGDIHADTWTLLSVRDVEWAPVVSRLGQRVRGG